MDLDFVLRAGQFVFTAAVGLYSLAAARRSSSKAEAEHLTNRLSSQDNRLLTLEQQALAGGAATGEDRGRQQRRSAGREAD
nr:hypothetical protein [Pseudomonas aeruginosa]